jgi:hypothetical protein
MPMTPASAKTERPKSGLTPSRLAAAAPGKVPSGKAWAAKVAPRSTTKKPAQPATTAMMVATIQVLIMKLANI